MHRTSLQLQIIKTIVIALFAILFLIPLLWMISSSLKSTNQVFTSPFRWFPEEIRWINYKKIWASTDMPLLRVFL